MLEEQLNLPLLERSAQGVEPTYFGYALAEHVQIIERECRHAVDRLRALRGAEDGEVHIGAAKSACSRIIPMAVQRLLDARPRVKVSVSESFNDDLFRRLHKGEFDFILCGLSSNEATSELALEPLYVDQLRIFCRRNHPLTLGTPVPADLTQFSWALPAIGPVRQRLTEFFLSCNLPLPSIVCETGSMRLIQSIVLETDFLSILSTETFSTRFVDHGMTILDFHAPFWDRPMGLSWRKRGFLTPATSALMNELRRVCRDSTISIPNNSSEGHRARTAGRIETP